MSSESLASQLVESTRQSVIAKSRDFRGDVASAFYEKDQGTDRAPRTGSTDDLVARTTALYDHLLNAGITPPSPSSLYTRLTAANGRQAFEARVTALGISREMTDDFVTVQENASISAKQAVTKHLVHDSVDLPLDFDPGVASAQSRADAYVRGLVRVLP